MRVPLNPSTYGDRVKNADSFHFSRTGDGTFVLSVKKVTNESESEIYLHMRSCVVYRCLAEFKMVGEMDGGTTSRSRGQSGSHMSFIGPALLPAVLFTAVPRAPPPISKPIPKVSMLVNDMLRTSAVERLSSTAPPVMGDDAAFSDPDSSLYDYEHMNDPGYSTVDFGTLERRRQMERERLRSPSGTPRDPAEDEGILPGRYHILEPAEIANEVEERQKQTENAPIYAVPHKVKSQKTYHRHSGLMRGAEPHTQGSPTTIESQAVAHPQGLGTMADMDERGRGIPDTDREVRQRMREVQNLPDVDDNEGNVGKEELEKASAELKKSIKVLKDEDMSIERQQQVLKRLEVQITELQKFSQELYTENAALKKGNSADIQAGDGSSVSTLKKHLVDLKEDNKVLKNTVHRLNIELSAYQAKYRPVQLGNELQEIVGLPSKGPIPSWLINSKCLAPLFLAYDDELSKKQKAIAQYEEIMEVFRVKTEELVKENEELIATKTMNQSTTSEDWQQLQEQARLVLEENQILMEQINVQQNKFKELQKSHSQEMAKLSKQVLSLRSEKTEREKVSEELKRSLMETKDHLEKSLHQTEDKTNHTVIELKKTVVESKEIYSKEIESLTTKYQALQQERKNLAYEVADLTAKNSQLEAELKSHQKAMKKVQGKISLMDKALEMSENKELSAHEHLANIIKLAERNAFERDTYAKAAKDKEHETRKAMNKLVAGNVTVGKLEEKLQNYKVKAAAKFNTVASKMAEQDSKFQSERLEYEREIKHLRLLVKEKELLLQSADTEKRAVEEDLEIMWQAANTENHMMQDTMRKSLRKLRQHQSLKGVCEPDNQELLYVSSDEDCGVDK